MAVFKFIDLFAGIGGIRRPFQKLGGTCVFSSEIDKFAIKTYEANWGLQRVKENQKNTLPKDICHQNV